MHKCIPLESPGEWKDAQKDISHSFYHTWENCHAMNLTTGYKTYLYVFEKENVKIICPVAEREYNGYVDITTPYGFSGFAGNRDFPDFINYWTEFAVKKNYICGYISLNPLTSSESYFNKKDSYISTNLYFIDLSKSLTDIFENLDANRRKQIKDFKKAEAGFIYDKDILTEFLINNYPDFLKRTNASKANYFSESTLRALCFSENVFMAGAGDKGKIEAVYVFGYTQFTGDCLFNVATVEGRKHTALLFWRGLKYFKSKKIPVMCLGGGIREDDNVAMSKERYGAYKLPFVNLKQIYDHERYNQLCILKNINPAEMNGYFPAYRK